MAEVGVRELRDNLSRYVARAREGEAVVVTEHGRAVARLTGLSGARTIDRLVDEGVVSRAERGTRTRPRRRTRPAGPVSDLVADQRR